MSIELRYKNQTVFNNWKISEYIGSGSQGKTGTFKIIRNQTGRKEIGVLKVINIFENNGHWNDLSNSERQEYNQYANTLIKKADNEVIIMEALSNDPYIVNYFDFLPTNRWDESEKFGWDFLIRMELLTPLRELQQQKSQFITQKEIIKIGKDICHALISCHNADIIHRDIKPDNIFRNQQGQYKLGDFGISRILERGNYTNTAIGTLAYCAPEQIRGIGYDKTIDIYSLGLTLYELANENKLPFADSRYADNEAISKRIEGVSLKKPSSVSSILSDIILKACAYKPNNRYQNAQIFLEALESIETIQKKEIFSKTVNFKQHFDPNTTQPALDKQTMKCNTSVDVTYSKNSSVNKKEITGKRNKNITFSRTAKVQSKKGKIQKKISSKIISRNVILLLFFILLVAVSCIKITKFSHSKTQSNEKIIDKLVTEEAKEAFQELNLTSWLDDLNYTIVNPISPTSFESWLDKHDYEWKEESNRKFSGNGYSLVEFGNWHAVYYSDLFSSKIQLTYSEKQNGTRVALYNKIYSVINKKMTEVIKKEQFIIWMQDNNKICYISLCQNGKLILYIEEFDSNSEYFKYHDSHATSTSIDFQTLATLPPISHLKTNDKNNILGDGLYSCSEEKIINTICVGTHYVQTMNYLLEGFEKSLGKESTMELNYVEPPCFNIAIKGSNNEFHIEGDLNNSKIYISIIPSNN